MSENQNLAVSKTESLSLSTIVTNSQDRLAAIERVGTWLAKSGMFHCSKMEQGMAIAISCMEMGMGIMQFRRKYHVYETGDISLRAGAAIAEFRRLGGIKKWIQLGDTETGDENTRCAILHLEYQGESIDYKYSMADARREGLIKPGSRWVKIPGNMLRARCETNGIGIVCPEIFFGDGDFEDEESATPAPELNMGKATVTASAPVEILRERSGQSERVTSAPKTPDSVAGVAPAPAIDVAATISPASVGAPAPTETHPTAQAGPGPTGNSQSQHSDANGDNSAGSKSVDANPAPSASASLPASPAIGVPVELVKQLFALVQAAESETPGFMLAGLKWLHAEHKPNFPDSPWLKLDEDYECLPLSKMKRIINQWPGWVAKVREFAGMPAAVKG